MYHKETLSTKAYYDTFEEMPSKAEVRFPVSDGKWEVRQMTAEEINALDNDGWYTILHSVNWGICDHWTSVKPSKWVRDRFNHIIRYQNNKGEIIGYDRLSWLLVLTRDANYWKAEVWNS